MQATMMVELSADGPMRCSQGSFRQRWPMYELVRRVTPSGRIYSSVTGLDRETNTLYVHTVELGNPDGLGLRAIRTLTDGDYQARGECYVS